MIKIIIVMLIGYLIGSLSPSAFIAMLKRKNLQELGTGNLGATNTMLSFGKGWGIVVLVFDVLKAVISVKMARLLLPKMAIAGIIGGCCAIIGHIYPFYMNFHGGKGVATFAGMILAIDPAMFLLLFIIGLVLSIVSNYGIAAPVSAAILAPFITAVKMKSIGAFLPLIGVGSLIIKKHSDNFERIKNGTEIKFRDYFKGTAR